jgi:hypothetical protein
MTTHERDLKVYNLAATMTYREMDDEIRSLSGRPLTPAQLERVHLLGSAQAQLQINQGKRA